MTSASTYDTESMRHKLAGLCDLAFMSLYLHAFYVSRCGNLLQLANSIDIT